VLVTYYFEHCNCCSVVINLVFIQHVLGLVLVLCVAIQHFCCQCVIRIQFSSDSFNWIELFECVDATIMDFIKESNFYHLV